MKNSVNTSSTTAAFEDPGTRILAKGITVSNDSRQTGLNQNDLICAVSGGGKTTGYVIPNLLNCTGSFVCADTKGNLMRKLTPSLKKKGYSIYCLDLKDMQSSDGYNPLDYIRRDRNGTYREQDILKLASALCPIPDDTRDPFWLQTAQSVIAGTIALVLEMRPKEEHNLITVARITNQMAPLPRYKDGSVDDCPMLHICNEFEMAHRKNRDSFAYRQYSSFTQCVETVTTFGCILEHVSSAIGGFDISEYRKVFDNKERVIDLCTIGDRKTAVFLNISDTSSEMYKIANLFYTQLLQALCDVADKSRDSRLKIPTRIYLDDFANNCYIPSFDKIISVIRSREISVSVILQSLSQLETLYSAPAAQTIINNADNMVFFGTNDIKTASFLSTRLNVPLEKILEMPIDKSYVLQRGRKAIFADRIMPTDYELPEAEPEEQEAVRKHEKPQSKAHDKVQDKAQVKAPAAETPHLNLNVPYKLISGINVSGKTMYRFSFTSGWTQNNTPIYSSVLLNEDQLSDGGSGKLAIDLGTPDKSYSLKTGNRFSGYKSAQNIFDIFNDNQSRYLTMLREKRTSA